MLEWLKGYKTYLAVAVALLTALGALLNGELNFYEFLLAVEAAFGGVFLRLGIKPDKVFTFLSGYKTYIAMLAAIVTAVMGWTNGELDMMQMIFAVQAAIAGIFMRKGVKEASTG